MKILLVDDREENLISLEDILEADNRVFLKARSGNEALKLALRNEDIGLIMLDVQMPGMDGFEVARLLKSNVRTREISIIFVTAINKEEQYALKGFDTGAVDYLQKPLDISITKAKVKVFEQLYFYQSELKESIAEKNKVNKQLERFSYVVAHDLKSPLSGIVSLMDIIHEDKRIDQFPDIKEYINLIVNAASHLTGMIGSILDYSRKTDTELQEEEVDVHALVSQIAQMLFPPAHIKIKIEGHLPVIHTMKFKLQQVFQNLISNAIKYMDKPKGLITIGYKNDNPEFHVFYVKDNGPGIAAKDHERIFRLFETTDTKSNTDDSSTGVGLNIMKMLVEEQGGKITVDSDEKKGSCFYFQWGRK